MAIAYLARGAVILGVGLMSACAISPQQRDWPYPEPPGSGDWGAESGQRTPDSRNGQPSDQQPPYGAADGSATDDQQQAPASSHPTVMALVKQAEQERSQGNLDRAAATLERAIRIVNDDPLPWLKLAEIRFEQSSFIQADTLARRSISFASSGPTARQAWLLIADIKRLQGDDAAAREAQAKAAESR